MHVCVCGSLSFSLARALSPASHHGAVLSNGSPSSASHNEAQATQVLEEGAKVMAEIQEKSLVTEKGRAALYLYYMCCLYKMMAGIQETSLVAQKGRAALRFPTTIVYLLPALCIPLTQRATPS